MWNSWWRFWWWFDGPLERFDLDEDFEGVRGGQ